MLITGGSGSGKTNLWLNLIKQQYNTDCVIDKICFYVKNPNEAKYHYLIKKHENSSLENLKYLDSYWIFN